MTYAFVTILVGIGSLFYQLMQLLADLFINVSLIQILNNDTVAIIYQRVGLILGIFMLFKITFSFIQMIIDPDIVTDKEKGFGNIIKKLVIVVVLLGITPSIFSGALELQNKLLGRNSDGSYKGENVISRIVLGKGNELGSFGRSFSATLFSSFFDSNASLSRDEFLEDFDYLLMYDRKIDYNSIGREGFGENIGSSFFMLAVGAFGCWVFLMYTLSTGLRAVQLMFLQLISPIPIISYVSSKKETAFHSWVKQCITTYIDLFIRLFILYIGILAISLLMSSNLQDQIALSIGDTYGPTGQGIITIVLIIGVLLFIKKAPDLIGELFPGLKNKASGDFGFGLKSRTDVPDFAKRGYGLAVGAVGAGQKNLRYSVGKGIDDFSKAYRNSIDGPNNSNMSEAEKRRKALFMGSKAAAKWAHRGVIGTVGAATGGAVRGIRTTDSSGRKTAAMNAFEATKSKNKMKDKGYKLGDRFADAGRVFTMRDSRVGEMATASDVQARVLQDKLLQERQHVENREWTITASKTKPGTYNMINNNDAKLNKYGVERNTVESTGGTGIEQNILVADLENELGKINSTSNAFHQKENEQKKQSGGK